MTRKTIDSYITIAIKEGVKATLHKRAIQEKEKQVTQNLQKKILKS